MNDIRGMIQWAESWAVRANVGYDQTYRTMQVRPDDGVTCFDCSSFTFFAMWLGGDFDLSQFGFSTNLSDYTSIPRTANAWAVTGMVRCLPILGFVSYANNITPQIGDIVVKTAQHCEMVYNTSPLQLVGARNSRPPLADQVAIHNVSNLSWYDQIWRYGGGPDPPTPPGQPIPIWLLRKAISNSGGGLFG